MQTFQLTQHQIIYSNSVREVGEANAAFFEMQQQIAEDTEFVDKITGIIVEKKLNAEYAVQETAEHLVKFGSETEKSYIQGHSSDIWDVSIRIIRILSRCWKDRLLTDEPFIMAASELYPSETMQLEALRSLFPSDAPGSWSSHGSHSASASCG